MSHVSPDAVKWVAEVADLEPDLMVTLTEAPSRDRWFEVILPALDYEVSGGTFDEPLWAWQRHPWFKELGLTVNECEDWFDQQNTAR